MITARLDGQLSSTQYLPTAEQFYIGGMYSVRGYEESYLGGDKKLTNFARGCDILIHDAQYTTEDYMSAISPKQGYGHSTFDMALEAKKQADAKKLIFFHYDPDYDDNKLNIIKEHYKAVCEDAILAYEGLEIEL